MNEKENKAFGLRDEQLEKVSGGVSVSVSVCHHPGCFTLNPRFAGKEMYPHMNGVNNRPDGNVIEPATCTLCAHWGVEGPCDLD